MMLAWMALWVVIEIIIFNPTKYWLAARSSLYRRLFEYEDISCLSVEEIREMLHMLLIMRCYSEDRVITERRNGHTVRYYPEDVEDNKRWVSGEYVEIECDLPHDAVIRVAFDKLGTAKFQLIIHQDDEVLRKMFADSKQGDSRDYIVTITKPSGRGDIIRRYCDYVIKCIL